MKRTLLLLAALFLTTSGLQAQDPFAQLVRSNSPDGQGLPPGVAPSNGMEWRPADAARLAVYRKAAWKAAQRRQRLEAAKWMGYSPLRPPASPLPFMGSAPTWVPVPYTGYAYPGRFYTYWAETPTTAR